MSIHSTAIIDEGAEIGNDVAIGPYSVIAANVKIGDGSVLGPHVTIHRFTEMGPGCRVHAGAVIGDVPQDLAFEEHHDSYVRIGANTTMREGVTIHRGTKAGTETRVGDECYLMENSHLAHNVQLGNKVIMAGNVMLAGYVEVGDGAFFAGGAAVHQFVKVGRLAMVSRCAITKDFLPFCVSRAETINRITGLNVVGLKRAGMGPDERREVKEAFRLIYLSGLNFSQAADAIRERFTSGPALEMADFIAASKRGICPMREQDAQE